MHKTIHIAKYKFVKLQNKREIKEICASKINKTRITNKTLKMAKT